MSAGAGTAGDPVSAQTDAVVAVLETALPPGVLVGVALYGSAATAGLRPDSDLDLFGVLSRRLTDDEKRDLVASLVPISWREVRPASWRPVELTLVVRDEVVPWRYPPRFDFQYGEWLRDELVAGDPARWRPVNPDVAVLMAMVRQTAVPFRGPHPADLLEPVPHDDLVRAIVDELPSLLVDLEADTRNVLLTLARMWVTVATGRITSKDGAANWAAERLAPAERALLERAWAGYLGTVDDRWEDRDAVRATAEVMADRIRSERTRRS